MIPGVARMGKPNRHPRFKKEQRETHFQPDFVFLASPKTQINTTGVFCELFLADLRVCSL